jgi:hypothetical protein
MARWRGVIPFLFLLPVPLVAQPGEEWVPIGVSRGGLARVSIDRASVDSNPEARIYVARVQEDFGANGARVSVGSQRVASTSFTRRVTVVRFDCRVRRLRRGASSLYRGTILIEARADFSADPVNADIDDTISDRDLVAAFCRGEWTASPST